MKPQLPTIKRDTDIGWEVFVPESLLPAALTTVSLSPEGLCIETIDGSWDLLPYQELCDLVEVGEDGCHLDNPIDIEVTRREALIATLSAPINIASGQPEPVLTGQERARRRWMADTEYLALYPEAERD